MLHEKSFGAVVFRKEHKDSVVLLLQYKRDAREYWDFPKGHAEAGEQALDAARRELQEETGITMISFVDGFKESINYFFKKEGELLAKVVDFYLGFTEQKEVTISFEHADYRWCTIEEAMKIMQFKNSREVLQKAVAFLKEHKVGIQKNLGASS